MKERINLMIIILGLAMSLSCNKSNQAHEQLTTNKKETLKAKISELGTQWSKGLKAKDISIIKNIYAEHAHYLPDNENAVHGRENIVNQWNGFMGIIQDLQLKLETLDGTEQLLYETGTGTVTMTNQSGGSDQFPFKYVNVWELQTDGNYKVVIDMYNDIKPQ